MQPVYKRSLALLWAGCLVRLLFYAAMLPLWEGYDEWAHFAVIRIMVDQKRPLVDRTMPVPPDIAASLEVVPLPWEMRGMPPPAVTQDVYWSLSPEQRASRAATARNPPPAYEALQPPFYYWLLSPCVWLAQGWQLGAQVLLARWLSVLVASLVVPLVFLLVREVFGDARVALASAAIVTLMPGFAYDVARVGNDALAVALFALLIWLGTKRAGWAFGIVLGLGLLTKAYFLAAIPAALPFRRNWRWQVVLPAACIGGWWYVRNLWTTGTLSGLSEAITLRGTNGPAMVQRAWEIPWVCAIDSILLSHIYFGGWSSLTVRGWMYHVFYAVIPVAAIGIVRAVRRPGVPWLTSVYAAFWLGQLYNVVLLYLTKGLPGSMGWYLYAVIAAEIAICVCGRYWVAITGVLLFAALDLYTVHAMAIPYYTGMIRHRTNGTLPAVHWVDAHGVPVFERLALFKPLPPFALAILWGAYLVATGLIVFTACRRAASQSKPSGPQLR